MVIRVKTVVASLLRSAFRHEGAIRVASVCFGGLAILLLVAVGIPLLRSQTSSAPASTKPTLVSTLESPAGVTVDVNGQLLVADAAAGIVYRIDADGNRSVEAEGFIQPQGIAMDGEGNLYVADAGADAVYLIPPDGDMIILADHLDGVKALAFDQSKSDVLVATESEILRISLDGSQTVIASGFLNAAGLAGDAAGNILVAAAGIVAAEHADLHLSAVAESLPTGPGLYQITPNGQVTRLLDTGAVVPTALAFDATGSLYVAGVTNAEASVYAVNAGHLEPVFTGLSTPRGLAAGDAALYVADETLGEVWRVPLEENAEGPVVAVTDRGGSTGPRSTSAATTGVATGATPNTSLPAGMTIVNGVAYLDGERVIAGSRAILAMACRNGSANLPDDPDDPHSCHPVNLRTGVKELTGTDLMVPGVMPIMFGHVYRSADNTTGRMGVGCTDSYDYRLRDVTASQAWLYLPTNMGYQFVKQPDGTYINTNTYWLAGARLSDSGVDGDTRFMLRFKDGTRFVFMSTGFGSLSYILDANNNQLELVRDGTGNLLAIRQPNGRCVTVTVSNGNISRVTDNAGRSVSYAYDGNSRLIAITNVLGGVTSLTYTNNNLQSVTLPNGVQSVFNVYDANGRVATQTLANAETLNFTYSTNAVSGVVTQTVMRNARGFGVTLGFSSTTGGQTSSVDAQGGTTSYVRDGSRALLQMTDPQSRTTSYVYDGNYNVTAITNALGKVTKFSYTAYFNRLSSVIDPLGRTNSLGYDSHGNLTGITNALGKVTTITYNDFGQPLTVTDPLNNTYTFSYNAMFDLEKVTDPLGNEVRRVTDTLGRPIALIDAFGRTTKITYSDGAGCGSCGSAMDLPATITDPINGVTTFKYDAVGNLTNVTDAVNHTVSYAYDSENRLTNRVDQLGHGELYRYDNNGNVTNFVDRRGVSVNFAYDSLDRRTGVVYAASDNVKYLYDKVGRVTNVVDSIAGTTKLTYDSLDRLTQVVDINGTIAYAYNDVGLRTNMTVTGQTAVAYRYDNANRLTNVVQGTTVSTLFYDDDGRRTKLTLPNGVNVLYTYDNASRLTNITYQAAVTNKIDYAYDQTGNRVLQNSGLSVYSLPSSVSTGTYNAANQQLTFGNYNVLYDLNGNVTNIINGTTTNNLLWSARNQLTNMTGAVAAMFKYDGLGRRILRTVNSNTENYLYDGLDIIQQLTNSTTVTVNYFRGLGIDEPWQRGEVYPAKHGTTVTNFVYLADALGSSVALADSSKVIQTSYAYEPFGNTTTTGTANKNSYKFTGREDDGTGLMYYRARYYHPALGRFLGEDPLDMFDGPNQYIYAGNDPNGSIDPFGLTNQIGDFGWRWYSFNFPSGMAAPWWGIYPYSKANLANAMRQTCERLKHPAHWEQEWMNFPFGTSNPIGRWHLQTAFDTSFVDKPWVNLEGTLVPGGDVNYYGQGMYDSYYGSIPYWKILPWKLLVKHEWPTSAIYYWYRQGLKCECQK